MAAGIPARIDGESLADQFAASMRLMNLIGTKVYVPTASLAQAREIVRPMQIDADELTRQALAAASPERMPPADGGATVITKPWARSVSRWLLVGMVGLPSAALAVWLLVELATAAFAAPWR